MQCVFESMCDCACRFVKHQEKNKKNRETEPKPRLWLPQVALVKRLANTTVTSTMTHNVLLKTFSKHDSNLNDDA